MDAHHKTLSPSAFPALQHCADCRPSNKWKARTFPPSTSNSPHPDFYNKQTHALKNYWISSGNAAAAAQCKRGFEKSK